jgi:hypothetical protein
MRGWLALIESVPEEEPVGVEVLEVLVLEVGVDATVDVLEEEDTIGIARKNAPAMMITITASPANALIPGRGSFKQRAPLLSRIYLFPEELGFPTRSPSTGRYLPRSRTNLGHH